MEGRPWLRVLLVLAGFLLLGVPVWTMTREKPDLVMAEKAPVSVEELRVALTFAEAPSDFTLAYLGKPLCAGQGPQREFGCDWKVGVPKEGVDLLLTANWASSSQTAVRVVVTRGDGILADQTIWGQGNAVETITIPGRAP